MYSRVLQRKSNRRANQSILKEINPEYSLEGLVLMLKLKLQYFGHLRRRANSLEKTLMLGKIEGRRRRGQQRTRWLGGITDSTDMSLSKLLETCFSRVMAGFSSYDGEFRMPLVLAQASPIFHSSCEGKLGIALE